MSLVTQPPNYLPLLYLSYIHPVSTLYPPYIDLDCPASAPELLLFLHSVCHLWKRHLVLKQSPESPTMEQLYQKILNDNTDLHLHQKPVWIF